MTPTLNHPVFREIYIFFNETVIYIYKPNSNKNIRLIRLVVVFVGAQVKLSSEKQKDEKVLTVLWGRVYQFFISLQLFIIRLVFPFYFNLFYSAILSCLCVYKIIRLTHCVVGFPLTRVSLSAICSVDFSVVLSFLITRSNKVCRSTCIFLGRYLCIFKNASNFWIYFLGHSVLTTYLFVYYMVFIFLFFRNSDDE